MTICNMSIEAGARAGMVAPDETTFAYLKGRPHAPQGQDWEDAVAYWRTLPSDEGARLRRRGVPRRRRARAVRDVGHEPRPGRVAQRRRPVAGRVRRPERARRRERALEYMDLEAGTPLKDVAVDAVFMGSCTNSRIEDLRAFASVIKGRTKADGVRVMVVPGSARVRLEAEAEGLDKVFTDFGAEWRFAGCSMCLGMNPDQLAPGERCASTSNRNFEGRQGKGGRTHLVSPLVAAATAVRGHAVESERSRCAAEVEALTWTTFTTHTGIAAAAQALRVDTDQIIPAVYLKRVTKTRLRGRAVRQLATGSRVRAQPAGVRRRVASSSPDPTSAPARVAEHAVWALRDFGFKVVLSTRFADIFRGNAGKQGLLTGVVTEADLEAIWARSRPSPASR